jgi:tail tube protein
MKFSGRGCQLLLKGGGATPTFTAVAQVQEIGAIDQTADELDVTTLDAIDTRDYIPGFKDTGESQIVLIFDPNLDSHGDGEDGLYGIWDRGETRDWAIRINSSAVGGAAYGTFSGFVRDWSWGAINADDPQTVSPTIRLRSKVALSDVAPTGLKTGGGAGIGDELEQLPKAA